MDKCRFCCTEIKDLTVKLQNNIIIKDVDLHLHCSELTVIVGKNGAGKSTLLKALIGDLEHDGSISFTSKHNKTKKMTIGYVPQKLNVDESPMSVYDLICSFCFKNPVFIFKSKKRYNQIKEHLREMGAESLIDKKVCKLSGGELQKVLIAIATLPFPELLILDEPISGIDIKGREIIYKLLDNIKKNHDISILMVSHDFDKIKEYADKVVLLNKKILKQGAPAEVFESDEFKREFYLGGENGSNI